MLWPDNICWCEEQGIKVRCKKLLWNTDQEIFIKELGEQLKFKKKNESILNKVLEYQIKSMNEKQQLNLLVTVLGQQQTEK